MPTTLSTAVRLKDHIGDTIRIEVDFGFNVSADTFSMQWRRTPADTTIAATPIVGMASAAAGIVTFTVASTTSAALAGDYFWDVQRVSAASGTDTVVAGRITLLRDVTR